ncbi:MAG: sulfotransferase [Pseudomonadota bacterium]
MENADRSAPVLAHDNTAEARTLVIGIGAQKAGTTWLARYLELHPDVHARRMDVNYWSTVRAPYLNVTLPFFGVKPVERYKPREKRVARLEELFADDPYDHSHYLSYLTVGLGDAPLTLDVSPSYALCGSATFAEMRACHPDVRFVFILRDPIDRLWSGIRYRLRDVLYADPEYAHLGDAFADALDDPYNIDLRYSMYDETLAALTAAGCTPLCLFYETLFTPEAVARLEAHIGIRDFAPDFGHRMHVGAGESRDLPGELRARARDVLAPTYDAVRAQFGREVPSEWA